MKRDMDRWSTLIGRLGLGESLSADDMAFVETMRRRAPACDAELEFLEQLSSAVDGPADPLPGGAELVRAALARAETGEDVGVTTEAKSPSRDTSRKQRLAWMSAAAAACVALALWLGGGSADPTIPSDVRLTLAAGDVYVDGEPAIGGTTTLAEGTTVAVTAGTACFAIDREIDVCLDQSTTVTVHDMDQPARWIEVHRGHAVARLEPQAAGRSFALATADVRATAVGTIFSLDVAEDRDGVAAAVLQGSIRLDVAGDVRELSAHEVAIVRERSVSLRSLSAEREATDLGLLSTVQGPRDVDLGQVVIECVPADATIAVDGVQLGTSPVLAALPPGEHRIELVADGRSRLYETLTVEPDAVVRRRFELSERPDGVETSVVVPQPIEAPDADEMDDPDGPAPTESERRSIRPADEMLFEARRHRQAGRWRAAARVYRQLWADHPRSSEARAALVSLGDLQLDRLGQPKAAARSYERYLEKGGDLAHEARLGRIRAYRALHDDGREAEAIRSFIRHHPKSARVEQLKSRLARLERQ